MTGMNPNAQPQGAFGSAMTGMSGARPSGRSWLDPQRMDERFLRRQDRQSRMGGGSGGGARQAVEPQIATADLPQGAMQENPTTGVKYMALPPSMDPNWESTKALNPNQKALAKRMGVTFDSQIGAYDPRTGQTRTLSPFEAAMRPGLVGAAQRALFEGLNRPKVGRVGVV